MCKGDRMGPALSASSTGDQRNATSHRTGHRTGTRTRP